MQINRHNYESFFLLYIDNELNAAERKAVEAFLEEHPDLAVELAQLQQMTLPAETVLFENKTTLNKTISPDYDENQELLLRKLDAELNDAEEEKWANLMQEEFWENEWGILSQTQLDKDEFIPFANKAMLYKKEQATLQPIYMLRWAIAAAIAGLGIFFGIRLIQSNAIQHTTPILTRTTLQNTDTQAVYQKKENQVALETLPDSKTRDENEWVRKNQTEKSVDARVDRWQAEPKPEQSIHTQNPVWANHTEPSELISLASTIETNQDLKQVSTDPADPAISLAANEMELPDIMPMEDLDEMQKNLLITAFSADPDADRILYMNQDMLKESKLGQFVKRTKESIENKTKIKTGRGLKIGNFEIAIR